MGASADEIDRQISSTRDQIDANLDVLERRAVSGARRVGMVAAAGLVAGLAIAGVAYVVYRRVRKPSLGERVLKKGLKARPFKVVITDRSEEADRGTWVSIGQKLAPTLVSSAVGAVMAQTRRRSSTKE